MAAVLGVDAAWTEHNPSGYALIEKVGADWRLRAAAANLQDFAKACGLKAGERAPISFSIACAERLLGEAPNLIAVDMPLSHAPITGRRPSDIGVSRRFGAAKCATHSPSAARPGKVSDRLHEDCKAKGYRLLTSYPSGLPRWLAEVYPHPALLRLMKADERVRYKVNKTGVYWREEKDPKRRLLLVKEILRSIVAALDDVVGGSRQSLTGQFDIERAEGFSALKPLEDTIDAIVSAWVGSTILENVAEAFGDETSAIWIPNEGRAARM
jgi:predicted RNase H-like nuclease